MWNVEEYAAKGGKCDEDFQKQAALPAGDINHGRSFGKVVGCNHGGILGRATARHRLIEDLRRIVMLGHVTE